jgi:hypothetical protein
MMSLLEKMVYGYALAGGPLRAGRAARRLF